MQTDYTGAPIYDRPFRGAPRPGTYYVGPSGQADPGTARKLVAKYASKCPVCKGAIEPGTAVYWEAGKRAIHVACPTPAQEAPVTEPKPTRKPAAFVPHPQAVAQAPFTQAIVFTGNPEADMALAAQTLSDAQLETAILATEPNSIVGRILIAELDRRIDAAVADDGANSYTGEDDLTERAIEARNDEWASRETALDEASAPYAPAPQSEPARIAVEDAGVYALPDGTVVRVKANKAKTRTYASRWTPTKHLDRLMEAGAHEHGEYVYEQGLVAEVARSGRKLTLEEAKAHSIRYGQCVRCGRALKDGKSVEQGMGPVCIRYFQG